MIPRSQSPWAFAEQYQVSAGSVQSKAPEAPKPQPSFGASLHTAVHQENWKNKDNIASSLKKSNLLNLKHVLCSESCLPIPFMLKRPSFLLSNDADSG